MVLLAALMACSGDGTTPPPPEPTADTGTAVDPFVEDRFSQIILEPVRIALVLDPSWGDGIQGIEDGLKKAIDEFLYANPEHKFGVVNADLSSQSKAGVMTAGWVGWPVPPGALDLPPAQASPEPRNAIFGALELRAEENDEFFDGADHLVFVIVTDKPDATDDDRLSVDDFLDWHADLTGYDSVKVSAIVPADIKPEYRKVVNQTNGLLYDVGSFEAGLIDVFRDAIDLRVTFTLSDVPREPPAEVDVIIQEVRFGFDIDEDYTYDPNENTITFTDYVPPPGSVVRVRYDRVTGTTTTGDAETGTAGSTEE